MMKSSHMVPTQANVHLELAGRFKVYRDALPSAGQQNVFKFALNGRVRITAHITLAFRKVCWIQLAPHLDWQITKKPRLTG